MIVVQVINLQLYLMAKKVVRLVMQLVLLVKIMQLNVHLVKAHSI